MRSPNLTLRDQIVGDGEPISTRLPPVKPAPNEVSIMRAALVKVTHAGSLLDAKAIASHAITDSDNLDKAGAELARRFGRNDCK